MGNFPYYSDGVAGEKYGSGNYKATNGRLYKVSSDGTSGTPLAWYPAPGYRTYHSGALGLVGSNSYSWSATIREITGKGLGFDMIWLNAGAERNRTYGFQLRCLSE
ncbi:hypothetical protein [uncultured Rikenella sp.]|uniref:hypothetical protein n=1 Tax=uncultured Rikenella sp. TaxID=368003 RepID=UPI0025E5C61A|nr:hypothetical protein [uncultured Rikenella sp.]